MLAVCLGPSFFKHSLIVALLTKECAALGTEDKGAARD